MSSLAVGGVLAVAIAGAAYRWKALDRSGAVAAVVLGTIVFGLGGPLWGILLVLFFVTSSALSLLGRETKRRRTAGIVAKGEQRDAWQVLANGGTGGLLAIAAALVPEAGWPFAAFVGATAAATSDTWATELGLLSTARPRRITSFRPALPGESGAVSVPGTLAAVAGGSLIGLAAMAGSRLPAPFGPVAPVAPGLMGLAGLIGGLAGALLDSVLGATLQASYFCPACGAPTERPIHSCGSATVLRRGLGWLNNDGVNFLACVCGATLGALLSLTLGGT
jgi:uncharacterized protein (TIGR00297 family)